ncbi:hypothetical protein ACVWYQ_002050 [Bradyrhizobium sp. USDA 3397]
MDPRLFSCALSADGVTIQHGRFDQLRCLLVQLERQNPQKNILRTENK